MNVYELSLPEDEKTNFRVIGNHIAFYGVCQTCGKIKPHLKKRGKANERP
jgi:translation initiation factor 2 beta subunit (eIF-2beta)/eIF-5